MFKVIVPYLSAVMLSNIEYLALTLITWFLFSQRILHITY